MPCSLGEEGKRKKRTVKHEDRGKVGKKEKNGFVTDKPPQLTQFQWNTERNMEKSVDACTACCVRAKTVRKEKKERV